MHINIQSVAGQGILSNPDNCTIEITSKVKFPKDTKNGAILLSTTRPINAMTTARWQIFDSNGVDRSPDRNSG